MIVYDVLQTVTPEGAKFSSYPIGTWLVDFFSNEKMAQTFAHRCNECCNVQGVSYSVQAIDECDPKRHIYARGK